MKNVYDELLKRFVADDEMRVELLQPFRVDDLLVSTDAHWAVFLEAHKAGEKYEENAKENITKAMRRYTSLSTNQDFVIKLSDLKTQFEKGDLEDDYDLVGENIDCKECDGEGEVEWEYGRYSMDFDCPECDGSGVSEIAKKIPNGKKKYSLYQHVKIKNSTFSLLVFSRIFEICELLQADEIKLIHQTEYNEPSVFEIADTKALVMPTTGNNVIIEFLA